MPRSHNACQNQTPRLDSAEPGAPRFDLLENIVDLVEGL